MAKNLPPIFKMGEKTPPKSHNMNYTYATDEPIQEEKVFISEISSNTVDETLNQIFSTKGYPFNIPVEITFAGKTIQTSLAARTKSAIITLDNETIPISTITSIIIKKAIDQ